MTNTDCHTDRSGSPDQNAGARSEGVDNHGRLIHMARNTVRIQNFSAGDQCLTVDFHGPDFDALSRRL